MIIETLEVPKTLASVIYIPIVENRNNVNSYCNIVAQNDIQYLCLYVILGRKKRPMEYIWTYNSSAGIIPKVPQTLALRNITPFIANLWCVLCGISSRDDITNNISKSLSYNIKEG